LLYSSPCVGPIDRLPTAMPSPTSGLATSAPGRSGRRPTARPSGSSKRWSASGLTPGPTRRTGIRADVPPMFVDFLQSRPTLHSTGRAVTHRAVNDVSRDWHIWHEDQDYVGGAALTRVAVLTWYDCSRQDSDAKHERRGLGPRRSFVCGRFDPRGVVRRG
jgi:hypothetical protein